MSEFKIHPDKESGFDSAQSADNDTLLYTFYGKHEWLDDEGFPRLSNNSFDPSQVHAKILDTGSRKKYYIRTGKYGKPFNPIGLYSEGTEYKQRNHAGKPEWELKPVAEKAFGFYINFLKTKNIAWLRNAEREL
jgi:hypothetical protein|tara:strand:- start:49 stop:450 length:402 start_codon:yes stop_codon:yes gene_type:complete